MKVLFASNNQGKVREIKAILELPRLEIISPNELFDQKFDVPETGATFIENARLKAHFFGQLSGLITLADDSGLSVDALDGQPGVYSARFAGTNHERIEKVLKLMSGINDPHRTAKFICAISVFNPSDQQFWDFQSHTLGKITRQPQGSGGFGYDPIFYSFELNQTFAQANPAEKNKISHRKKAIELAKPILERLIKP